MSSEDDADLAELDGIVRGDDGRLRAKMARNANGARLFEDDENAGWFRSSCL